VFVTTPFHAAVSDTSRSLALFHDEDVPVLGLVVNMAGFTCPTCGDDHDLFEHGDPTTDLDAPVLAELSFDPEMQGTPAPAELPEQAARLGDAVADRIDDVWGLDLPESAVDLRGVPPEDCEDCVESAFRATDPSERFVVASDRDPSPVRRFLASLSPAVADPEDLAPFEVERATPETWVAETVRPRE
jgi:ATP-binding protein involved in chromosome partitioning